LSAVVSGSPTDEQIKFALRRSHLSPLTATTATFTGRLLPKGLLDYIRFRLIQAGYPQDRHVGIFLATQVALAILFGLASYVILDAQPFMSRVPAMSIVMLGIAAGLMAAFLPFAWLRFAAESRRKNLLRALPDTLDLMVISVTAGLSLDTAMTEVVRKWDGDLSREFTQILNEMRMGVSRRDALTHFANRLRIDDIQLLVAALLQADEMGSDISEVLSSQADQLRIRRRHHAEERARKAPIKMLIPMVLLIFPAMFAILLAPGMLQFIDAMKGLSH
jgi:tight adherence protein C